MSKLDLFQQCIKNLKDKRSTFLEQNVPMDMIDKIIMPELIKSEFKGYPDDLVANFVIDFDNSVKVFDYIFDRLKKLIEKYTNPKDFKEALNKYLLIKYDKIDCYNHLIDWFEANDIIEDYVGQNKIEIDLDSFDKYNTDISTLNLRPNQKEAFDRLEKYGLETGIHCQATGCGKTFIILRYLDYVNKINKNAKVILFTERVNILADLFEFDKLSLEPSKSKLLKWKNMGLADLTNYTIIERILTKNDEWIDELNDNDGPTLVVINRAYLTLRKKYKRLEKVDLILHDECHNTSSNQCHKFLKFCDTELDSKIVGFSATPLRTGKNDVPRLMEIYGNKENNLNLLTDYNMIQAISKDMILPPDFYWYQMIETNKDKNKLVTQLELGSIMELLVHIVPKLPNKKLVAWCRTIALAKEWKRLFESCYGQRRALIDFTFGLDISTNGEEDYEKFKKSDGNMILFCANKHREGSDIPKLDGCIFLDKVKKRSPIPFIQSIGRVLRKDPDNPAKVKGVIIDGYVKNNGGYEREFIDKIIDYYLSIQNLTLVDKKEMITKYDK